MKTDFYSQEFGRWALLTAEQEVKLFKRMKSGDQAARDRIIRENLGLVAFAAKDFKNSPLSTDDLLQAGCIGLMTAAGKFDYRLGFRFSTYAVPWVKQAIRQELYNNRRTIRLPVHVLVQRNRMARETAQLEQILGRPPRDTEIASRLDWPLERVRAVKEAVKDKISLDTPFADAEEDLSLMDCTIDKRAEDPAAMAEAALLRRDIEDILSFLNPVERTVLKMRYGLNDGYPLTLEKCGARLKISRERVRQMEKRALIRLRQLPRCQRLKAYL
jgi:RNA polymerase primary sigma factor